ncbi:MAG TPA: DUF1549 and DUF1553 domain-containing protein, partial [Gemmataceae bacterium]|nr:DUF1549 and DUF1553 domain-containing protein [Gemmataceae bacterium]
TLAEQEAFLRHPTLEALDRVIEDLLARPAYGERWARHWLDLARYAETNGYERDATRPNAWRYRDYVIRAFNDDKPYRRFVQEQLAADVLFPNEPHLTPALGFIAAGPWDFIGHAEVPESKIDGKVARHLDRDDMVTNTIQTFNSLTVQCAQCHHHKFDPISQEDYYSLQAVFAAVDRADRSYDTDPALARKRAELKGKPKEFAALPPPRLAFIATVHTGEGAFRGTGHEGGKARPIHVLARGSVLKPGMEVGPGALQAVTALPAHFDLQPNHSEGDRRAALAKWLTDPRHPLTWRSIVNRVWHYHFGKGIVETPNDFGRNGQLPTHPELLDWLAAEFRDNGQSLKALHRLIVTSTTYRQSSAGNPAREKIDADNRYLWRANRRRLEAEAVRDSVLMIAGKLDRTMYGPSFQDFVIDKPEHSPHYEYHLANPEDRRLHRRAVYRFIVRSQQQPFMTTLDCADPSMQVDRRNESNSALQALAMLNNDLMIVMAKYYADNLKQRGKGVEQAYYECLGRRPNAEEKAELTEFAERHGLANVCRVLFNLNGFAFVD